MKPSLATESALNAYMELQKPIYHTPINLGINKLKRELRELYSSMPKSRLNTIIKAYKKRGWSEYEGVMRHRGTFPTHPEYRTSTVEVNATEETTEIKVQNGHKQK